tara:strand:- start:795 stop:977 length:183 start_codon:yes stop_codon:yes gene_type:complete
MVAKELELRCSFCSKNEEEVKKLFSGKGALICDQCVEVAFDSKDEDNTKKLIKHHLLQKE